MSEDYITRAEFEAYKKLQDKQIILLNKRREQEDESHLGTIAYTAFAGLLGALTYFSYKAHGLTPENVIMGLGALSSAMGVGFEFERFGKRQREISILEKEVAELKTKPEPGTSV